MSMMNSFRTDRVINITNSITSRKLHINQEGLDMVAALRRFYEDSFYEKTGQEVQLSLPALVHCVLKEHIKELEAKGFDVMGSDDVDLED